MLLIILLGVIAKLVAISADCDTDTVNRNITDWSTFTGIWYWLYHTPHKYDENVDCPVITFEEKTNNMGTVTAYVYIKSTQTFDKFVGAVTDWNAKGYIDMIFPLSTSDTRCPAGASCSKNPYYARNWTGKLHVLSGDYSRYSILKYCCPTQDTTCFYVTFRTPNPDEGTLNEVKKDLKEIGLDLNQLMKYTTDHCGDIKLP